MPIPRVAARANRYFLNPLMRLVAGWAPGFCLLRHVGRRSGRTYSIPLNVFHAGGGFVFALTYGPKTDWIANVLAAGRCTIRHRRNYIALTRPRFLATEDGMGHIPAPVRVLLRLLHVTQFLHLVPLTQAEERRGREAGPTTDD